MPVTDVNTLELVRPSTSLVIIKEFERHSEPAMLAQRAMLRVACQRRVWGTVAYQGSDWGFGAVELQLPAALPKQGRSLHNCAQLCCSSNANTSGSSTAARRPLPRSLRRQRRIARLRDRKKGVGATQRNARASRGGSSTKRAAGVASASDSSEAEEGDHVEVRVCWLNAGGNQWAFAEYNSV